MRREQKLHFFLCLIEKKGGQANILYSNYNITRKYRSKNSLQLPESLADQEVEILLVIHSKISDAYWKFKDAEGFAKVMSNKEVLENNGNLSLQFYVK